MVWWQEDADASEWSDDEQWDVVHAPVDDKKFRAGLRRVFRKGIRRKFVKPKAKSRPSKFRRRVAKPDVGRPQVPMSLAAAEASVAAAAATAIANLTSNPRSPPPPVVYPSPPDSAVDKTVELTQYDAEDLAAWLEDEAIREDAAKVAVAKEWAAYYGDNWQDVKRGWDRDTGKTASYYAERLHLAKNRAANQRRWDDVNTAAQEAHMKREMWLERLERERQAERRRAAEAERRREYDQRPRAADRAGNVEPADDIFSQGTLRYLASIKK